MRRLTRAKHTSYQIKEGFNFRHPILSCTNQENGTTEMYC